MHRNPADRRFRQMLREAIQGQVPIEQLVEEVKRIHGPRNLAAIDKAIKQVVEGDTKRYTVRRGAAADNVVEIAGEAARRAAAYWERILLRSGLADLTDGDSARADFLEGLLFVDTDHEWSDAPPQIDYDGVRPVDKFEEDSESLTEIMDRLGFEDEANSLHLWRSSQYHGPRWFEVELHAANLVAQGYGVEAIFAPEGYGELIAEYVNMGDAYFPTILMPSVDFGEFEAHDFYLISWGDFLEAYEQHVAEEDALWGEGDYEDEDDED